MTTLRGYDEWKTTEPRDPYSELCDDCGEDCRRWECDACGRRVSSPSTCTEDCFCSMACAASAER